MSQSPTGLYKCKYCNEAVSNDLRRVVFHEQFCDANTEEYRRNEAMERAEYIRERQRGK